MNSKEKNTDEYLVQQYVGGNTSVLSVLVKRYHQLFCKKAYWVTKDKEIAKDVAQECWIIIINKLHTLENPGHFKNWAFRIIYNKSIDALKRKKRENKNVENSHDLEWEDESFRDTKSEVESSLLSAIKELPKGKQDIIRLFYAEEYSIREISKFLGIPIGTVKSRLFKAREKLKSILKNKS